jgi:hypothetical protein
MKLPEHKCGLYLTHNEHKDLYEKLSDKFKEETEYYTDMSQEDKEECIKADSLWTLQWYPDTPIGFYVVHGPTLERVLELAEKVEATK